MHRPPFRPRSTAVALALIGGCLLGVTSAHAASHPDHGGLPNVDRRAADAAPVPAAQRDARRTLDRSLGKTGEVRTDRASGGIAQVGRTDALLTGPSSRTPEQVVLDYVREHRSAFGLTKRDMANLRLVARSVSPDGITHLRYNQVLDGVLAFDSGVTGHVTRDGRLVTVTGAPVPNAALPSTAPPLSAGASLGRARTAVRTAGLPPRATDVRPGASRQTTFASGEQAVLRWSATADGPRLAWSVLTDADDGHRYDVLIDAENGAMLRRQDLTSHLGQARFFPADPETNPREAGSGLPPASVTMDPSWYDQHDFGSRLWGQFARTYIDFLDEDPAPGDEQGGNRIQIPASNQFLTPTEPDWLYAQQTFPAAAPCPPSGCTWNSAAAGSDVFNRFQAATNAHVLVSRFHDHLQAAPIGFDAASGNFQRTNPAGVGAGNDYVRVEVNDGEGRNNANMSTPPDGFAPRMQMYLWDADADVNGSDEAAIVYHEYGHGLSNRLMVNASGASNITTAQAAMMGEAISDFYALDLLVHEGSLSDTAAHGDLRLGTYATNGYGIRAKPIDCPVDEHGTTPDCNRNDTATTILGGYTYGDIAHTLNFAGPDLDFTPHNGGEVWAETLWEIRQEFGRDTALQLITGGMRLVGAAPSMLDMRDAILRQAVAMRSDPDAADPVYAGLWEIFRERGFGRSASSANEFAPVESFAGPAGVVPGTPAVSDPYPGGDNDGVLEPGETVAVHVPVTGIGLDDLLGVTGTLSNAGGPALTIGPGTTAWPKLGRGLTASNAQPLTATLPPNVCAARSELSITFDSTEGPATATAAIDPRPGTSVAGAIDNAPGTPEDPINGVTTATFAVTGSGTISDLDLRIDELEHSWLGDLTVELIHPDGTTATILDRLGAGDYNGTSITQAIFDSDAAATLPTTGYDEEGHPPITGRLRPESTLNVFDGKPVAGTWKLRITDGYPGDAGVLTRWGLDASGATISCGRLEIPTASTDAPSVLGQTAARVAGRVAPNGRATGLRFAYGTTSDYGRTTATIDVGAGDGAQLRTADLGDLQPGTTYHYRVEAIRENGQVAVAGEDRTFTTDAPAQEPGPPPPPSPPIWIGDPLTDVTAPRFVGKVRTSLAKVRKAKPLRKRASFRFRLSEPAQVTATVTRTLPGVRKGKRCVAKPKRPAKNARRCTRTVTVTTAKATVRNAGATATLRLRKSGLPRGDYRVRLVAVDPSGNRSKATALRLRVR
jgi:subtilisin-like proprotein convertase family protein